MALFKCEECEYSVSVSDEHIGKRTKCPSCKQSGTIVNADSEVISMPSASDLDNNPIILKSSGGPIQTKLLDNIILNKESSLEREFITIVDPSLPAGLTSCVGIKTTYQSDTSFSSGGYRYTARYSIKTLEPIFAFEVRFLLFNVWGRHVTTLSATEILDMPEGTVRSFDAKWNLFSENEASKHYASIAYVAVIRDSFGKVLEADIQPVLTEARRFSERFSDSDLEPTPRTAPGAR
jgi:hypothetical protein